MYLNLLLTAAFFNALIVSYGFPRSSTSIVPRSKLTLSSRQSQSCNCQTTTTGCPGCSGTCCPSGSVCYSINGQQPIFSQDACCTGNTCAGAAPSGSSSSSPAPSSTPQPSSTTPVTPTSEPVPSSTSSAPSAATAAPAPTTSSNKTGAIVGGAVGGTAAVALAAIIAWLTTQNGGYILGSLAAALFGLFLFKSRRLVFSVDDDIGPTQISLFLTPHKKLSDTAVTDPQKILVWKVFDIGHAQRQFEVTVPCVYRVGALKLGFGTIEDEGSHVRCVNFSPGPAYLDSDGIWHTDDEKPMDGKSKQPNPFARNDGDQASKLAIGTIDESGDDMAPFLLLENSEFGNGSEYHAASDFYLHVFRSVGYTAGKYKNTIVKDIEGDRLTPVDGLRVKSLRPLTSWRIRSAGSDGKLKLEITNNRKEDVHRYKHDCTIKKAAKDDGNNLG